MCRVARGNEERANLAIQVLVLEIKKRRERGKSHRGAQGANTGEVVRNSWRYRSATARLERSKGRASEATPIKTMSYAQFETVAAVTRIVRFGRKAACQVSLRVNAATLVRTPETVFSTCRIECVRLPRREPALAT